MHKLFYSLIIISLLSCKESVINPPEAKFEFYKPLTYSSCFPNVDIYNHPGGPGCDGNLYKVLSEKLTIKICPGIEVKNGECFNIAIDSIRGVAISELHVFDKGGANLGNICTCMESNYVEPTRILHPYSGQIVVGFSDTFAKNERKYYFTTVLIKELVFKDNKTGEKFVVKDEKLFDRVSNWMFE